MNKYPGIGIEMNQNHAIGIITTSGRGMIYTDTGRPTDIGISITSGIGEYFQYRYW